MAIKSAIMGRHVNMAPTLVNNYFDNKTINFCKAIIKISLCLPISEILIL